MSEKIILSRQPHWDDKDIANPHGCCSSDGVSVYADGSACCHACGAQLFPHPSKFNYFKWCDGESGEVSQSMSNQTKTLDSEQKLELELRNYEKASYKGFKDRGISIQTAQFFGVKTDVAGNVYFPYYSKSTNRICGLKIRTPNKNFRIVGTVTGKEVMLFGQNKFKQGGKYCTIHEGEFDALAGYQMMGSKFVNISIPTGANSALQPVKNNIDYLSSFEKTVLSFDGDDAGKKAQQAVAPTFEPGTCLLVDLPEDRKDACEFLKEGKASDYMSLFWGSKVYTPAGIVNLADDFERLFERTNKESIPYPWEALNLKTNGLRYKELVTLCAGTGTGKSTIIRALCHHLLDVTEDNIGVLFLEEDPDRTKLGIMGYHAGKAMHLNEVFAECTREEVKEAFDATVGTGRFFAFNHFGSAAIDDMLARVRYLIKGLDCKWIVLDHLSIVVSGIDDGDERKAIDVAMTKLRTIVEETGVGLILVSHLKRVDSARGHENGAEISLAHLRGSQAIAQLSDIVIGLERDQQADNPILANTTRIRVLKNRYTGKVGSAGFLLFSPETGRLIEVDEEALEFQDEAGDF